MYKVATLFLQSRFRGKRFENGQIPLDLLADFSSLGQLITEIVKWRIHQEHPESKSSDVKKIISKYNIVLRKIEEGSAVLTLDLISDIRQRELPNTNDILNFFQLAKNDFIDSINSASKNNISVGILPENILIQVAKIGRYLREEESLEFLKDKNTDPVILTKETNENFKQLIKIQFQSVTRAVKIRGFIPEVDQDRKTFHMEFADGERAKGSISNKHLDIIILGFTGYSKRKRLFVDGLADIDKNDKIIRWASINNISLTDSLDVPFCLEELKNLKNGWLDGVQGLALDHESLNWLGNLFVKYFPDHLPLPYTYPTPDGGVQMEWTFSNIEVELEINLLNRKGKWFSFDTSIEENYYIREIILENSENWKWIASQIESMRN